MGNILSPSGDIYAITAVSKYMFITKEQIIDLRDSFKSLCNDDGTIQRRFFQIAVSNANLQARPDSEILDLLFTMWDLTGKNNVPYLPFIVGISSLACRGENLDAIVRFALQVYDVQNTKVISNDETLTILKSMTATASYFGDSILTQTQIYKIVDSIFDTITMISASDESLSHAETIELMMQHPIVHIMVNHKPRSQKVKFAYTNSPFAKTRLEETSVTDVSSVHLTPLHRRALADSTSNSWSKDPTGQFSISNSQSLMMLGQVPLETQSPMSQKAS